MWWKLIEEKNLTKILNNNLWPLPIMRRKVQAKAITIFHFPNIVKGKKKNTKNNVMNCSSMPCPTLYHNKAWNWLIYTRNKMLLKIDCAINNWCIILCFLNTIKRIAHNVALFLNIIKFTQLLFTMWTWCV